MSDETKLKPCPFCGRKDSTYAYDDLDRDGISARAVCCSCGVELAVGHELPRNGATEKDVAKKLKAKAIALWNRRRPHPDAVREARERLRDTLTDSEPVEKGILPEAYIDCKDIAALRTILDYIKERDDG